MTRPSVIAMGLATLALALASAERTFQGMRNFTGAAGEDQQFGTAVSFLITAGVQVLMVLLSWRIGDAYASRGTGYDTPLARPRRNFFGRNFFVRHFFLIFSFLVCAGVCVFFSFDAFFQGISTVKQRDIVSRNEASRVLRAIDDGLTSDLANRVEAAAGSLSSGVAWNEYEANIDRVVDAATAPALVEAAETRAKQQAAKAEQLATEASKDAEARQKEQNEAEAKTNTFANEKRRLDAVAKEAAAALAGLQKDRADSVEQLAAKNAEVDQLRQQMDEEDKIGSGRVNDRGHLDTGRGPRWDKLNANYQLRNKEKQDLDAKVKKLESDIAAADQKSRGADADVGKAALDLSNAEAAVQAIKAKNKAIAPVDGEQANVGRGLATVSDEARHLKGLPTEFFHDRTSGNWSNIEKQCNRVVSLLGQIPEGRATADGLKCEPPVEIRKLATSFFELGQRQKALASCTSPDTSAFSFQQLIDQGRKCLQIAQLQDRTAAGLENDLDRVAEEQDAKAHTFVRTISAFERGDKLAYIALGIALSLDGLIVLSGIWGARANASELTRGNGITVSEIDDHAKMVMGVEIRPEKLRPPMGWPEPPEVYKARLFHKHLKRYSDPAQPQFGGIISCAELGENERAAINSVLAIGAFAQPVEDRSRADTWLVKWPLIHYVTAIGGTFDRVERIRQATAEAPATMARTPAPAPVEVFRPGEAESGSAYWARAAAAAKSGRPAESESELAGRGYVDRVHEAFRDDVVPAETENDNSVVRPGWAAPRTDRQAAAG